MQNLSEVRVDKDLLLKFFLVFARFEYALKHAGFAQGDQNQIRPDWTEFANRIHQSFNRSTSNELAEAVEYILRINPPMKEVLINGKVAWDSSLPDHGSS
ncbi:MAG TPA: hypothetical protein VLY20_10865, partial [Nitrospiria bacterium]|nr:hypothetical protein [Nitrospiria bacterium]